MAGRSFGNSLTFLPFSLRTRLTPSLTRFESDFHLVCVGELRKTLQKSRDYYCRFRCRNHSSFVRNLSAFRHQTPVDGGETNMAATRVCRGLFPSSSSVKNAAKGIRKTGVYNLQGQICVRVILCLFLRHQLFLVRVVFV